MIYVCSIYFFICNFIVYHKRPFIAQYRIILYYGLHLTFYFIFCLDIRRRRLFIEVLLSRRSVYGNQNDTKTNYFHRRIFQNNQIYKTWNIVTFNILLQWVGNKLSRLFHWTKYYLVCVFYLKTWPPHYYLFGQKPLWILFILQLMIENRLTKIQNVIDNFLRLYNT